MFTVRAKPKCKCEELDRLRDEAKFAALQAGQTGSLSQFAAAERQKEAHRKIDLLIQHLLVGHDGKPCPAGDRPIVKPRRA